MGAVSNTQPEPSSPAGLGYVLRGGAMMVGLLTLYYFPYPPDGAMGQALDAFLRLQATHSGWLIGLFDPTVQVHGTFIEGAYPLRIVKTCSALDVQALYAAAVLVFPASLRFKALGLLAGSAALYALNLLRVAVLY